MTFGLVRWASVEHCSIYAILIGFGGPCGVRFAVDNRQLSNATVKIDFESANDPRKREGLAARWVR